MLKKCFDRQGKLFMSVIAAAVIPASLVIATSPAISATLTPNDNNSIVAFDTNSPNGPFLWDVDGVNHLYQNSLWYRVGSEGGEKSVDTLKLIDLEQPSANQFDATYASKDFNIKLDFTLHGGALDSGKSNLFETATVENTSAKPLDLHLFEYTDFDLNGKGDHDTGEISSNATTQSDNITLAKEVVAPAARNYEVNSFSALLDALQDDAPTTLTNFSGPLTGDIAYAYQWDSTLNPGKLFSVEINKSIAPIESVPEPPMTLSFLSLGSLMILWRLRKAVTSRST